MSLPIVSGKYRKPARILAQLLCFSGLAVWLFHFYVRYQYDGTRPLHPDAFSGRVYPQNSHGHVVYLTKEEDARITKLTFLAFSLFGAGFLVEGLFVEKIVWRKSPAPWEKKRW